VARKTTGKPVGPPPKPIDWELFEQLCGIQCTQPEIASMLKVSDDTLRKKVLDNYGEKYSEIYKRFSESGKCSLRRNQFVLSKTNAAMAIWLGKQYLGQKEPDPPVILVRQESKPYIKELYETIKANPFPKTMGSDRDCG